MRDVDIYSAADEAIKTMNRDILRDFGKLKLAKFDELHIIRDVNDLYRRQALKARKRYYEVSFEACLLGFYLCGKSGREAQKLADDIITQEWIEGLLDEPDLVTQYSFTRETERKAQRLIEALTAEAEKAAGTGRVSPENVQTSGKDALIDKAIREWSKQVGQYALNVTDAAIMEAYEKAGIEKGMWDTEKDQRVCTTCHALDGMIFLLSEVPAKPHWGCRCRILPVRETAEG